MAAKKVKVVYMDGREVEVLVPPRAQVMTEQYVSGFKSENAILSTYHLGWAALKTAGKESADFDTWLDSINDVEDVTEEVPPTPPAQSEDTSSDSASCPRSRTRSSSVRTGKRSTRTRNCLRK